MLVKSRPVEIFHRRTSTGLIYKNCPDWWIFDRVPPVNMEDQLFDMFKDENDNTVHMGKFLAALTETGMRKGDPRLAELRRNLMEVHTTMDDPRHSPPFSISVDRPTFKR
ncbi:hypothetical protein GWK47_045822 [Chionoecetes opilio]|uniref:Glutaminase EF-hand domain-containing protein n=1 Tax=Chionoecetes opilio TaxID=41210 RepID=A0A8J4Y5Z5_CHIOP|nr:hypothetical protein GWK47_045822 [Chionoecetes opilio]